MDKRAQTLTPTARLARVTVEECHDKGLDIAELIDGIRDEVEGQAKECRAHPKDFATADLVWWDQQVAQLRRSQVTAVFTTVA